MISGSPVADIAQGFVPLASLLRKVAPEHLDFARQRIEALGREELIGRFRESFANNKRLAAYILSSELTWRGVPPCFHHEYLDWGEASLNQRYDLLMADLIWMRRWYPEHVKVIRYRRCKLLLTGNETQLHQEAEYAYWAGT
ncbi:hypothetical protein FHW67_003506 [Herbaspirillum sp. Sphag1AN]|nr:hypothetical protein [Herbaspirillum sp. Sphag1AN]MBB3247254.1 hypothetical protein [Herbaspirillum sp. Sphag64]